MEAGPLVAGPGGDLAAAGALGADATLGRRVAQMADRKGAAGLLALDLHQRSRCWCDNNHCVSNDHLLQAKEESRDIITS